MEKEKHAFFTIQCKNERLFVIKFVEKKKIDEARQIISNGLNEKYHIQGKIVKKKAKYNAFWSFILSPKSISFFQFSTEICDATSEYVEEHLDEVGSDFLPNNIWCPWCSKLVKEINEKEARNLSAENKWKSK